MCVHHRAMAPEKRNLLKAMVSTGPLGPGAVTGGVPKTNPGAAVLVSWAAPFEREPFFSGWKVVAPMKVGH
jgi:hypothetical protein